jgi:hypothetical protein
MRTSCALGGATSTSSTDNFPPASHAIAACPAISCRREIRGGASYLANNRLSSCIRHFFELLCYSIKRDLSMKYKGMEMRVVFCGWCLCCSSTYGASFDEIWWSLFPAHQPPSKFKTGGCAGCRLPDSIGRRVTNVRTAVPVNWPLSGGSTRIIREAKRKTDETIVDMALYTPANLDSTQFCIHPVEITIDGNQSEAPVTFLFDSRSIDWSYCSDRNKAHSVSVKI